MKMKTLGVAAASTVAVLATVAPAAAGTVTNGAYSQNTGALSCDTDTNTLSVPVSGRETRPAGNHFRTDHLTTRIRAQVQNNDGSWSTVEVGSLVSGKPGVVRSNDAGTVNFRKFNWGGSTRPVLSIQVNPNDNLFRATITSRLYDNEGVLIRVLVNTQGQCRLPSNAARLGR